MKGFHAVEIESTRLSIGPSVNSGHSELRIEMQFAGYLLDAIGQSPHRLAPLPECEAWLFRSELA